MLAARSLVQARDARRVAGMVVPSRQFADALIADVGIASGRVRVVANPVDLDSFLPAPSTHEDRPLRILFLSRLAARKGVEVVIELSHRLRDLRGRVEIEVVGAGSLWSDYWPLLQELEPSTTVVRPHLDDRADVAAAYARSDVAMQPSHYEPFGLTMAEALASGRPVLASTVVGALEHVDRRCAHVVTPGDVNAIEQHVRRWVEKPSELRDHKVRELARAEAERLFAPAQVARDVAASIAALISESSA
jgi:glycosyltransferase involved in cell wall biosynthesis